VPDKKEADGALARQKSDFHTPVDGIVVSLALRDHTLDRYTLLHTREVEHNVLGISQTKNV
jgi:hypothetical protein